MWILISLSSYLFSVGFLGFVLNQRNLLVMLLSVELMLFSVNLGLSIFSVYLDDITGQVWTLLVLVVAASETAISLGILVSYYRVKHSISIMYLNLLRG